MAGYVLLETFDTFEAVETIESVGSLEVLIPFNGLLEQLEEELFNSDSIS